MITIIGARKREGMPEREPKSYTGIEWIEIDVEAKIISSRSTGNTKAR